MTKLVLFQMTMTSVAFLLCSALNENNICCSIAFVIISQKNDYHRQIAVSKKENLTSQIANLKCMNTMIYVAPDDFDNVFGYWTIIPLIEKMKYISDWNWIFFMEETTSVNVQKLCDLTSKYLFKEDKFLGYALKDKQPTIIHHFDTTDEFNSLKYPHFTVGFLVSRILIMRDNVPWINDFPGFSIDAKYEMAKFLLQHGVVLEHSSQFCLKQKEHCISWMTANSPICKNVFLENEVVFAVKTFETYHKDRVQVVKNTWAKDAKQIYFFSNVEDLTIPTINLGIKNVKIGHCGKTLAILKYVSELQVPLKWLVVADDDTLISVPRLLQLLPCYNSSELIALGERYGYKTTTPQGYDYITGGGGMVFSMPLVKMLASVCICPTIDSPDDMILGMCLKEIDVPIVHSHYFHQARPEDYAVDYINTHLQISFHKHWLVDPYYVYNTFLSNFPLDMVLHSEL